MENLKVGNIVKFGEYDWRVLDAQNGKALLLSDRVIEMRAYHRVLEDVTWAECELRCYLNGELLGNFSANDRSRIVETTVLTHHNPWYGTNGGAKTKDSLFLLSIEEVINYFGDSGQLKCGPPEDDDFIGCIDDESNSLRVAYDKNGDNSWWWLRSPGKLNSYSALVTDEGEISIYGPFTDHVLAFGAGVRPALWLNL